MITTSMKKTNIGVLTFPISEAGNIPLSNLIDILHSISNDLYLITGNDGYMFFKEDKRIHTPGIKHERGKNVFTRILKFVYTQLRISYKLARIAKSVDIWIFFIGGDTLVLPMLTAKLLRKKVVIVSAGSSLQSLKSANDNLSKPVEILENVNRFLSDQIAVESKGSIGFLRLNKYRKKISVTGTVFVDTDNFKITKELKNRKNLIGYIGRLSSEKGVLNFAKAIPLILKERNDLDFLIGGGGLLFEEIKNELKNNGSYNKVELPGWISHDELPKYLNELKLIVSPSYTEGGVPTVIMEAMACGTVSLVTPVAGVDVIKDGESGFILENNSPECIAKNVIRALEHPNLDEIVNNACNLVEEEFSYEKVVKQYRDMLYGLLYK